MAKLFDSKAAFAKHFKLEAQANRSRNELQETLETILGREINYFEQMKFQSGRLGLRLVTIGNDGEEACVQNVYFTTINTLVKNHLAKKLRK